jgi:energy-coupling factor transporter ATP-binding protein EcfA2
MSTESMIETVDEARRSTAARFAQALGLSTVQTSLEMVGGRQFLKFNVGRNAPVYDHALRETQKALSEENPFRGLLGLSIQHQPHFPISVEAEVLRGVLARSTRVISTDSRASSLSQYVPFQNNEESLVIQPATHLIIGRRGVGKSTLIARAQELIKGTGKLSVVIDSQPYAQLTGDALYFDLLADMTRAIGRIAQDSGSGELAVEFFALGEKLLSGEVQVPRIATTLRRLIDKLTTALATDLYVFLDDFHLIQNSLQPGVIEVIHGSLKGARGWLKIAGLQSLLKHYDPKTRQGVQTPGDAQVISLDLTLVDPEAAQDHLRKILASFLNMVGIEKTTHAIADSAFQRLVWANAGVPRDFLQMFAASIEHAARVDRTKVELTDANLAIGEVGQQKVAELEQDARNEEGQLRSLLSAIEDYCLGKKKINAFLIRNTSSTEFRLVGTLSDLRLLHVLHKTITPHKAGERYEAYMLDYSLFTGFRRRPNIKQIMPADGSQFKASELRKIPILPRTLFNL